MAVTLESLRKSIKKNANSMAFAWLADLEREAGDLDKALQRVDGGLTLYPNDIAARLVRSKILFQQEAFEPCVQECERILVIDPFNLAAQRIMGDAYDKLGDEGARNRCYRRLHDMDPLNTFWKEEYDVVIDAAVAASTAAAMSDEFTLSGDDFSLSQMDQPSDDSLTMGAEPVENESTQEAPEENAFDVPDSESVDVPVDADDPFASLAAMLPNSDAADDSAVEDLSASLDSVMDSISTELSADSAMEEFPADENISSSDVGSALSDMFGLDDDLEPEAEPNAQAGISAPLASDIPASIDEAAEENAANIFETAAEDKPQSVDSAFDSIFGEDELPEEKPQESSPLSSEGEPELPVEEGGLFEKSADADMKLADSTESVEEWSPASTPAIEEPASEAAAEDAPTTIDNAFDSIFGEDELPEEKPQEETLDISDEPTLDAAPEVASDAELSELSGEDELELPVEEGGLFEKSADADMKLADSTESVEEWSPAPQPAAEETPALEEPALESPADTAAADAPTTIDNAFDSIFGEDELPEEKPQEESLDVSAEPALDAAPEVSAEADLSDLPMDDSLELPADEGGLFEKSAEATSELAEAPAEESLELPADLEASEIETEKTESLEPAAKDFSVDSAFDSLFGADDDLPEEKPQQASEEIQEPVQEENVSLAEQVDQAESELEMPEVKQDTSDLAQEMGGAFASMFGNDDDDLDLPEAKSDEVPAADDQEVTGAPIEESLGSANESLSEELDDSFDNLFGKEDAVVEDSKPQNAETVEAPAVETSQDLDSLESEVSGAFKGLFDMDDDSLTEESKPSNKGVDFLMSGDSDDEISSGLISNPDAPLDRGAHNLDESLNTRTLAEIYFDQGLYGKALEIYKDLVQKEPENEEIAARMAEVEKIYKDKFGGEA